MKTFNQVFDKLNKVLSNQTEQPYSVYFKHGNFVDTMAKTAEEKAPFGRVAIFYTKDTFELYGKEISLSIRKKGIKTVNVILPESAKSVDEICKLFNLPEDVRMAFVTDAVNYQTASYYASINQIPCGYLLGDLDFSNLLSAKVKLKNGISQDFFNLDCERHVFINEKSVLSCQNQAKDLYIKIMCSLVALIDYKIGCFFNKEQISSSAVKIVESSTRELFSYVENDGEDQINFLFCHGILIEIANLLTKGKLLDNSALSLAKSIYLANNVDKECNQTWLSIQLSLKLLQLYLLYFSQNYKNLPDTPNYSARANKLVEMEFGGEYQMLLNFTKQIEKAKEGLSEQNLQEFNSLIKELSKQTKATLSAFISLKDSYIKENGNLQAINSKLLATCIKYSGDGLGVFNTATLLRDGGFMEFPSFADEFNV